MIRKKRLVVIALVVSIFFVLPVMGNAQIPKDINLANAAEVQFATSTKQQNEAKNENEKVRDQKESDLSFDDKVSITGSVSKVSSSKNDKEKDDDQEMLEKALDLIEAADDFWGKGDVENTLNSLDKAYALILDAEGDAAISRQKDDLRLLISKRILAIYSAKQATTSGKASEIPLIMNSDVEKEIHSFQGYEREYFISSYKRSGIFRPLIINELKKAGLPEELSWLPLVESGFKIQALSRARALGLWQFIPSTGYKFGLSRDEWIDERMDILKSTQAAIAYLKELHAMFGDWLTVLAAYNCGEGRVLRVISRQRVNYFDRFWDLYNQLPHETARYVPRFLATIHIIRNPQKYGMDLGNEIEKNIAFETVQVNKIMKIQDIASKLDVSEETLNLLNSELRYKITPDKEYALKIPVNTKEKFQSIVNDIPETEKPKLTSERTVFVKHRVKKGETIASIAKRYKVSYSTIAKYNNINSKKALVSGQRLKIPIIRTVSFAKNKNKGQKQKNQSALAETNQTYKVKRGDTLIIIAKRFDIPINKLKEINRLKSNVLRIGQVLLLSKVEESDGAGENNREIKRSAKATKREQISGQTLSANDVDNLGTNKYIVKKVYNLSIIARKNKTTIAKLLALNNISGEETLTPGRILTIK